MAQVLCDITDNIAYVTLSSPGKLNALNVAMWTSLREHFDTLSRNEDLRCIIVSGADGNFAAGADISEFATVRSNLADGMRYHTETIALALQAIEHCLHPVIAAIQGVCVGGGLEIACACDLRIAAPDSRFGIPINRLGFPLAPGELQGLLDLVGKATAMEILLEGRVFDAAEAREKGLIHRVAEDSQAEAQNSARRIAAGGPLAARTNKMLARRLNVTSAALSDAELKQIFSFLESQDYKEGVLSFLEKRPPRFIGK